MKNQKGFTLVELIIVIVILGILAVTAAPRFIDIQSDARASAIKGVSGALQSASQLVYARAAISGLQGDAAASVSVAGNTVAIVNGYPDASDVDTVTSGTTHIQYFMDINTTDFDVVELNSRATSFVILFAADNITTTGSWDGFVTNGDNSEDDDCWVLYDEAATAGSSPTITTATTGC